MQRKDDLECPVCLSNFDTKLNVPQVIFPCGHSVCLSCIQLIRQKESEKQKCPLCQETIKNITKNFALLRLIDCLENMQTEGDIENRNTKVRRKSIVKSLTQEAATLEDQEDIEHLCPVHFQEKDLFCKSCFTIICHICVKFGDHKNHQIQELQKSTKEITENTDSLKIILKDRSYLLKEIIQTQIQDKQAIQEIFETKKQELLKQQSNLIKQIKFIVKEKIDKLEQELERAYTETDFSIQSNKDIYNNLEQCLMNQDIFGNQQQKDINFEDLLIHYNKCKNLLESTNTIQHYDVQIHTDLQSQNIIQGVSDYINFKILGEYKNIIVTGTNQQQKDWENILFMKPESKKFIELNVKQNKCRTQEMQMNQVDFTAKILQIAKDQLVISGGMENPHQLLIVCKNQVNEGQTSEYRSLFAHFDHGIVQHPITKGVYIISGKAKENHFQSENEKFDMTIQKFSRLSKIPVSVCKFGCGILYEKIYVFGGKTVLEQKTDLIQCLDIFNDVWIEMKICLPQPAWIKCSNLTSPYGVLLIDDSIGAGLSNTYIFDGENIQKHGEKYQGDFAVNTPICLEEKVYIFSNHGRIHVYELAKKEWDLYFKAF